jgi:hypothetical protein
MKKLNKPSLTFIRLSEAYDPNINPDCIQDIKDFLDLLKNLDLTKVTRYHELDSFSKPVYKFIDEKLKKYGFVNGKPELNINNLEVQLWWKLYSEVSCSQYSPFYNDIVEDVDRHHISAFARNYCLMKEVEFFLNNGII